MRELLRRGYLRCWRGGDFPGRLRLLRWAEPKLSEAELGVPTPTKQGFSLYTDSHDWVEREVLETGTYEPQTMAFLEKAISPGDLVVCSGAAYGLHLLLASRASGSAGRVFGIDPQPAALQQCRANLDLNHELLVAPVELISAALMEAPGTFSFSPIGGDSRGNSSVGPQTEGNNLCKGDTLENHLAERGETQPPALAYLDIEGAEIAVLRTFRPDWRPQILIIEMNSIVLEQTGTTREDYFREFDRLGYQVTDLNGEELRAETIPDEENVIARAQ